MDLTLTPDQQAFRERVRTWLKANIPAEWKTLASRPGGPLHPVEVGRAVQQVLDGARDAVLVADSGEFGQWAQACTSAPTRLINGPGGSIGSAIPFALAARVARPGATVVAMLGDGTFGFHLAEFDTATRAQLPFLAVIGNDACWNQIAREQVEILQDDVGTVLEQGHARLLRLRFSAQEELAEHRKVLVIRVSDAVVVERPARALRPR